MKLSIVTPTFNSQSTIARTIQSILMQDYKNYECIFIDGKSTDKTLDIIQSFVPKFQKKRISVRIVAEKDQGIYDAMNKGIALADGDALGFLNSDDYFATPYTLSIIANALCSSQSDCIFGDILFINQNEKIIRDGKGSPYTPKSFKYGWHPMHPTFYAKKDIYKKYGGFNLKYKIAADYEIMLRFLEKHKITSTYIPEILVKMQVGGTSNGSLWNILKANYECFQAWRENSLSVLPLFILFKPVKKVFNRLKYLIR